MGEKNSFELLPLFDRNDKNIIVIIEAQARLKGNKTDFDIVSYDKETKEYLFGEYNEYNYIECDNYTVHEDDGTEHEHHYSYSEFNIGDEAKASVRNCYENGWTYSTFQFKEIDGKLFMAKSLDTGWEEIFDPAEIDKYNIKQGIPLIKDTIQDGFVDNRYN